jgi:cell division protease FtsH
VFLGRDFGHTRNYSEEIAARIDAEIEKIISDAYHQTKEKLTVHMDQLHTIAKYLMENEKMDGEVFKELMEGTVTSENTEE